jgi:hypothetical protein
MLTIAEHLAAARIAVRETISEPRIGWAWLEPAYRADPNRAFFGTFHPLTIDDDGLLALEKAMKALLDDERVRRTWQPEDLWTTVLSLLSAAVNNPSLDLQHAVDRLVKPAPTRTVAALSNVTWTAEPTLVGDIGIASLSSNLDAESFAGLLELDGVAASDLVSHAEQLLRESGSYVVASSASERQGELAYEDFARGIEDLIGLILLLSPRLDEFGIFSLRGATNRPGVRGTTLDRVALGGLLETKGAGELAARVLSIGGWGASNGFRWQSADPMPIDSLLDGDLRPVIADLLSAGDAIARRLRVASRWYAQAFWAEVEVDAALSVSVALDALLTGKQALAGGVSKQRFSLLERDPSERPMRFKRYDKVYAVRSAIVHGGGGTRALQKLGGARSLLADARWVTARFLELRTLFAPDSDNDLMELWNSLEGGSVPWTYGYDAD